MVGVVSLSDVVKILSSSTSLSPKMDKSPPNLSEKLKHIERRLLDLLHTSGELADSMGLKIYVVGGFVRDLVLSKPNDDIDLVVEGDGLLFAQKLAEKLGTKCKLHKEFNTATVDTSWDLKIDVASARLEYYPQPVALPVVQLSNLKMDLYRLKNTKNISFSKQIFFF